MKLSLSLTFLLIFSFNCHNTVSEEIIYSAPANASLITSDEECYSCTRNSKMEESDLSDHSEKSSASMSSMSNKSYNLSIEQSISIPWANQVAPKAKKAGRIPWFSQKPTPQMVERRQREVKEAMRKYGRQTFCNKVCSNWLGQWLVHTDCKCPPMNNNGKMPVWGCQNFKILNHLTGECECKLNCRWLETLDKEKCQCVRM